MKIRFLFAFLAAILAMPVNSYAQEYDASDDTVYVEDTSTYDSGDQDASGSYEEESDQVSGYEEEEESSYPAGSED
jgi:hypothetical protein